MGAAGWMKKIEMVGIKNEMWQNMETTCVDIFHVSPGGEVIVDGCGKSWQKISDTGYQRVEDAFYWHMDPRHTNHVMNAFPPSVEELAYARKYYT